MVRQTPAQEAVLNLLEKAQQALTVEEILQDINLSVNKTTVYRMLERFVAAGKVHFVTDSHGKAHYALCATGCNQDHIMHNHVHFQCEICKTVTCLPTKIELPELEDYVIHDMQFLTVGICPKCQ